MILLAQVTPSVVPQDPAEWSAYLVVLGVGGAIGWGIESLRKSREIKKLNAEIKKLETEEVKLAGEVLKELQLSRSNYSDACTRCREAIAAVRQLIESDSSAESVTEARTNLCAVISEEVLLKLTSFAEWNCLSRKSDVDGLLHYLRTDLVDELIRLKQWVTVVNMPRFLSEEERVPLQIQERTLRPFMALLRFVPEPRKAEVTEPLRLAVQGIVDQ